MFPCCHLCGKKYIKENGTFDELRFKDMQQKRIIELIETKSFKSIEYLLNESICTCECHQDGIDIFH